MRRKFAGAAIFAVLLSVVFAGIYRYVASFVLRQQMAQADQMWGTATGYLRIEKYGPDWFYDPYDAEQAAAVTRAQHVYLLAGPDGRTLQYSNAFRRIGLPNPSFVRAELQRSPERPAFRRADGTLLRSGMIRGRDGRPYYLLIGTDVSDADRVLSHVRIAFIIAVALLTALWFALANWAGHSRPAAPAT